MRPFEPEEEEEEEGEGDRAVFNFFPVRMPLPRSVRT